jgi:hypothetical protein
VVRLLEDMKQEHEIYQDDGISIIKFDYGISIIKIDYGISIMKIDYGISIIKFDYGNTEGDSQHMRAEVKQKLSIISSHPTQSSQRAQTRSSIRQQQLISSFTAEEEEDSNLTDSQLLAHAGKKSMTVKGAKSSTTKSGTGTTAKDAKPDFNRHVGTATAAKKIKTS